MKSDEELLTWFRKYVPYVNNLSTDFRNGVALLDFVEALSGIKYPRTQNPTTLDHFHKNVTISFMAIYNIYDGLEIPEVSADDIVEGNHPKIKLLLQALSSDEWECIEEITEEITTYEEVPIREPFTIEKCDLSTYDVDKIKLLQAAVRRHQVTKIFKKLDKTRKFRDKTIRELVETEEVYVQCLNTLVETYYDGLKWKAEVMQQPILSAEEIEIVFTNIHPILKLNTELLEEFQLRLDIWDYRKTIGDILINFAPKLEAYTEYCNHYENAIAVVEKAKKRAAFSSYLEDCKNKLQKDQNYFNSLLITPIQRGPRYLLLLREILSRTNKEHPDYKLIQEAMSKVELQLNNVNNKIKESQAKNAVFLIQEQLIGENIPELSTENRMYISESSFKLCHLDSKQGKEFQTIALFLFNDSLLYTKKNSSSLTSPILLVYLQFNLSHSLKDGVYLEGLLLSFSANQENEQVNSSTFKFKALIPFDRGIRIKDIPDMGVVKNAFNIISVEKTLTVMSHAPEHKKEWMNLINEQLNRAPKPGRGSFIASSSESSESSAQDGDVYTLSATITGADTLFDANGRGFTCYRIEVTPIDGEKYVVYRRYREFDSLWRTLRKKYPEKNLMQLPKKHIIGNLARDIIESRRVMLETFLEDVLAKPEVCQSSEFVIFLLPSDNYKEAAAVKGKVTKLQIPEHLKQQEKQKKVEEKQTKKKKKSLFGTLKGKKKATSAQDLTDLGSTRKLSRSVTTDSLASYYDDNNAKSLNTISLPPKPASEQQVNESSKPVKALSSTQSLDKRGSIIDFSLFESKKVFTKKKKQTSNEVVGNFLEKAEESSMDPKLPAGAVPIAGGVGSRSYSTSTASAPLSGSRGARSASVALVLPPVPSAGALRPTNKFNENFDFVKTTHTSSMPPSTSHAPSTPTDSSSTTKEYRSKTKSHAPIESQHPIRSLTSPPVPDNKPSSHAANFAPKAKSKSRSNFSFGTTKEKSSSRKRRESEGGPAEI